MSDLIAKLRELEAKLPSGPFQTDIDDNGDIVIESEGAPVATVYRAGAESPLNKADIASINDGALALTRLIVAIRNNLTALLACASEMERQAHVYQLGGELYLEKDGRPSPKKK